MTGDSAGATSGFDYATVAYDTAAGARVWVQRYNGPANDFDYPAASAVGPRGSRVFVTGLSMGTGQSEEGFDYATIAYRA